VHLDAAQIEARQYAGEYIRHLGALTHRQQLCALEQVVAVLPLAGDAGDVQLDARPAEQPPDQRLGDQQALHPARRNGLPLDVEQAALGPQSVAGLRQREPVVPHDLLPDRLHDTQQQR